jgi:hypothetical protein
VGHGRDGLGRPETVAHAAVEVAEGGRAAVECLCCEAGCRGHGMDQLPGGNQA